MVVLVREENSYSNPVYSLITEIVHSSQTYDAGNHHNDIFIINSNNIPDEDINLVFYASARLVFEGGRGTMKEQMLTLDHTVSADDPPISYEPDITEYKALNQPSKVYSDSDINKLLFFNGIGGFANDGKEYVIKLEDGQMTPAPWVNVISNPDFGFMVTETGEFFGVKIAEKTKFLLGQMIQCVTAGERYSTYASYSTRMRE